MLLCKGVVDVAAVFAGPYQVCPGPGSPLSLV